MRSSRMIPASVLALVMAAGPAAGFTGHDDTASLEVPLASDLRRASAAARPFEPALPGRGDGLAPDWRVQLDPGTGRVRMAWGRHVVLASAVRSETQAELLARQFLQERPMIVGMRTDNSELRSVRHARGKWAVHFRQVIRGVPVWNGTAFVLLGDDGRVAAFGSEFLPEPAQPDAAPTLASSSALSSAARSIGAVPRSDRATLADLFWLPRPSEEEIGLGLAWRVVFETEEPFGKWETFVDGRTGEILGRRNLYFPVDIVGDTHGSTAANPVSYGWCDGFSDYPYAHMNVSVSGGGTGTSGLDGAFVIPHGGTGPAQVTAGFQGPFSAVHRHVGLGADASQTLTIIPGVPFSFFWNDTNSRSDERTTFYHANRVHDFMRSIDPTFTQLSYSMRSIVGRTDGFCPGNAWWDGTGMNYCAPGMVGGTAYYNTGLMGNVIYHEFGHGVTQEVYLRNGQFEPPSGLHEGNSDAIANFLDRNSYTGLGFSSSTGCGNGIRNAVNTLRYPAYDETGGHTAGQVISGFHWLAWQSMLAALPPAEADSVAFATWHYARDLGTPRTFPDQVLWTFLVDDDDADLSNGTPHYDHICPAAEEKGFTCPEVLVGVFIVHDELPHTLDGSTGFDVVATVTSTEAAIDGSQVKTFYRLDGGPFVELAMAPTGNPDEYLAHIAPVPPITEVEYYLSAADMLGNERTSPRNAPASLHGFDVAAQYDPLESGAAGWMAGLDDDTATSGWWGLFDPVGTAAQPENDATPDPGVMCFITGQCAAGHGGCTSGCDLYCNDVDNGFTTLLSPVYDLTGATSAVIKYSRWYSNDTDSAPGEDFWVVDVSNDGGATWTNVENTNVSAAVWTDVRVDVGALFGTPGQVQLRFVASDLGSGSIVEGGVDDVRILADYGPGVDAPEIGTAAPIRLAMEPSRPNPFRGTTQVDLTIPQRVDVGLAVYDVSGRIVRTLLDGRREAGRYRTEWDGRDEQGRRVAAGVYFFRLTTDTESVTRKVTVMQ